MHTNIQYTLQYFRNTPLTDTQNTKSTTQGVRCYSWGWAHCIFELLWKIVTIPYQHDQHHNFKSFCQNLTSWLHVVFKISSRKVFPPTGAHKAQDETLRAHRARLSARRRKSSAAPRLEWKGVAKGQRGLTLVGNIQARSSFTLPSIFSRETQVTNTQVFLACIGCTLIFCSDIWIWNTVKLTD